MTPEWALASAAYSARQAPSDTEKTYTLEEVRDAFVQGAAYMVGHADRPDFIATQRAAERCYPSPKKPPSPKKSREVIFESHAYRVIDGVVQIRVAEWHRVAEIPEYYNFLHDLIAHPFEEDKE